MHSADGTTTIFNESGIPNIPGPYLSPEQTESFPLKQALYGSVQKTSQGCCSCLQSDEGGGSLRVIITCFFTLTLALTVGLAAQIYFGDYQLVPHGSVATDSHVCSLIGTDILKHGGNAIDAAVAGTICMGVVNPHVTGLGGGGFLLVYDHRKKMVLDVIDFREEAPASSSEVKMSENEPLGRFIGVPGLMRGLGLAHTLYGRLLWKDVILPSVELAKSGFRVPQSLIWARQFHLSSDRKENTKLLEVMNSLEPGQNLSLPHLAAALERIATLGPDELYTGSLSEKIIAAVIKAGGNMTHNDLANFQPVRRKALQARFANFDVFVPGPPSGGPFLLSALELLQSINLTSEDFQTIQILADKLEYTFEMYKGLWGDPAFNESRYEQETNITAWNFPEAVASHVAAVDLNDLYVSVVSGLNTWFGSQIMTDSEFVLNNALTNFGIGNNSIAPGKRPLSLATPVIVTQTHNVCGQRLVLGAGDATVAAQLLAQLLLLDKNVTVSVEAPRFRVIPASKQLNYEVWNLSTLSNITLVKLEALGYKVQVLQKPYQSCNLVGKNGDSLTSHSDSRGGGVASRF